MSLSINGTITKIYDVETGTSKAGKEWNKQAFKIDTKAKFNPDVVFSLFGDKLDLITNFKEGQEVEVSFNVSSREFNGKFYHNLDAWRINKMGDENVTELAISEAPRAQEPVDDLPF